MDLGRENAYTEGDLEDVRGWAHRKILECLSSVYYGLASCFQFDGEVVEGIIVEACGREILRSGVGVEEFR